MTDKTPEQEKSRLPVAVGVPLNGLDEAYRLSQNLALATVLPRDLRGKPSDVLAIVLYGRDLGLSPMQSIQGIYVVKGKPQLSATTWTALARRAGHKVTWGACDDRAATVTITRADDQENPHTETFTIEDAVQARLCRIEDGKVIARSQSGEPLPWETYTKTMLRNRAISNCGKLQCPEVALGFAIEGDYDYVPDEVTVVAPEHHGAESEVIDAEVVEDPDRLRDELAQAEAEFTRQAPGDLTCGVCGAVGDHFEDACPKAAA